MDQSLAQLLGDGFDLMGTLLIAYAALSVHHRFRHEHKVDDEVFNAMRIEIKLGFFGIALIVIGFAFKVIADFGGLMAFEDYKSKDFVSLVYTGEGKGKTSASLGLLCRALGAGDRVAFIQFIKHWDVSEHAFLDSINELYETQLTFIKYGHGFFDAGELSADGVSDQQHKQAANDAYQAALDAVNSNDFELVICDEINNAVHDGLLDQKQLDQLILAAKEKVSLCLTGRNFPEQLLEKVDIATNMTKLRHHFDDGFIANKGIDY